MSFSNPQSDPRPPRPGLAQRLVTRFQALLLRVRDQIRDRSVLGGVPLPEQVRKNTSTHHTEALGLDVGDARMRERALELAQVNEALRVERDRLRAIIEHSHTQLAYLDHDFNFLEVNSAYVQGSGHTKDELLGHNHFGLFPDPENQAIFERVRDTGQPAQFRAKPFQYADQPGRGITYWDWTLNPVLDQYQEVQGLVFSLMDVTEREDVAYRATVERLRLATTAAGLGVFEWDVAADHAFWENERMFEIFGRQRVEGALTMAQLRSGVLHLDDREAFERDLAEGMCPDRYFLSTCRIRRGTDQAWRWIEFLGRFTHGLDGRPLRLVGTVADITDRRQALDSLRESEDRLSFALEVGQMGHWELDLLDHTVHRSLRHDQIFGYSELLPRWTYEMFHDHVVPEDRNRVAAAFIAVLEQGTNWDFECRITRADGALRWIWACGRLRHDDCGQPRRLVGIVQDITARKQTEEERERLLDENRYHREFLERLMHAAPVGIAVLGGPDHQFEFANPYYQACLDRAFPDASNQSVIGRRLAQVLPPPAGRGIAALLDQSRATGATTSLHEFSVPPETGDEPSYWNVDHVPLRDGGHTDRILALLSDVTEQVRARKQLEQLANRDQAILTHMTEGVMIADGHGNVLAINPAARRIHGHSESEKIDQAMEAFVPAFELRAPDGPALPVTEWPLSRVLRGEIFGSYELIVERTDTGQLKHVSYGGAPVRDENGRIALAIVTSRDVTAQKEAEQDRERLMHQLHEQNITLQHLTLELAQEGSRLQAIIGNAPDGMVVADAQGRIILTNAAADRLFARPIPYGQDYTSHAILNLCHPDGRPYDPRYLPQTRSALDGETVASTEMALAWPDGRRRDLLASSAPIRDAQGVVTGAVAAFQDITEVKRTQEALRLALHASRQREAEVLNLLSISHDVASTLELEPLLDVILDRLQLMIECTGCAVYLLEDDILVPMDYHGPLPRDEAMRLSFSWRGAAGVQEVVEQRQVVILDDVQSDSAQAQAWRANALPEQNILLGAARSWMAVPLITKNQVIGFIRFEHLEPERFGPHDARLALAIADQAALAVENARLYARAQYVATIEERQRIARELHDSVSQVLYSIVLGSRTARMMLDRDPQKAAEPIDYVFSLAEAGLAEMRALIFELRPDALQSEGLVHALERRIDVLRARHGLQVAASLCEEPVCAVEVKEAIYRVAQEAMHNATKHARATEVGLTLESGPTAIQLYITDNGVGFDPDESYPGRMGLRSMRERVLRLGGALHIASTPGHGSVVHVEIPLQEG